VPLLPCGELNKKKDTEINMFIKSVL